METDLPSCFLILFLELLLKFLVNFTLLNRLSLREVMAFNHKRADFWLPNFGIFSLLSLLKTNFVNIVYSLRFDTVVASPRSDKIPTQLLSFHNCINFPHILE